MATLNRMFILNDEQINLPLSNSLEDYEYITEVDVRKERLINENGHLKKGEYTIKNKYYAKHLILTEDIRKSILDVCERENYIACFYQLMKFLMH